MLRTAQQPVRMRINTAAIAFFAIFALLATIGAVIGSSFLGSTAHMPQPTPPSGETREAYKTFDDLPNTKAFPNAGQLTQYNTASQQLINAVQTVNAETGGGLTTTQIDNMALLQENVDLNFVSAQELAKSLQMIYPNVDVLAVFNSLPQEILTIFETPPVMVIPYFGG